MPGKGMIMSNIKNTHDQLVQYMSRRAPATGSAQAQIKHRSDTDQSHISVGLMCVSCGFDVGFMWV
jgi:hypothetical protein